jgi:hypothetical protein
VLYDWDDRETHYYTRRVLGGACRSILHEGDKPHLASFFNTLYNSTADWGDGTLVSMLGDDMEFLTKDWDQRVLEVANKTDGVSIIYGDDRYIQHEKMTVHFFTSRKVVDATGVPFMWPKWRSNMIDYIWTCVGKKLGILEYLPNVWIRHNHSSKNGIEADETYHRMDPYRQFAAGKSGMINAYVDKIVANVRASGICSK